MSDLISRQDAIDEIKKCRFVVDAIEKIGALPSAQPKYQLEPAKEYCAECDHVEMCRWYPFEGCEFRSLPSAQQWISCSERLPETDMKVLVNLHNTYGKDVILMASHIGYHERTSEDYGWQEFEGDTEYDEENDCFWIPECWCESNYVEDNANWIIDECEGTITHWMPLPRTYEDENNES